MTDFHADLDLIRQALQLAKDMVTQDTGAQDEFDDALVTVDEFEHQLQEQEQALRQIADPSWWGPHITEVGHGKPPATWWRDKTAAMRLAHAAISSQPEKRRNGISNQQSEESDG